MKNIVWFICLLVVGCKEGGPIKQNAQEIKALSSLKLSPIADSLLREYVKVFPAAPAYAIFIDKKTGTQEYMLTIAPFNKAVKSMYESGAANYFMMTDTTPVFLYTGLEDFIVSYTSEFNKAKVRPSDVPKNGEFSDYDPISRKVNFMQSWSYVHLDTVSYIIKGNSYPFINQVIKPDIQFIAPNSSMVK